MARIAKASLLIIAAVLMLAPSRTARGYQQTDGVFVGKGRVARRSAPPRSRDERPRDERARDEGELKPMIAGRAIRELESLEQQCLEGINRQREARGLAPLTYSEELLEVARYYSRRMAEEGFFSHTDPEGHTVRQRVSAAGIRWRVLGENLAYTNGYINPVAASISGWMDSPGHRKNILDPDYKHTAIGAWISDNGTVYFTEIFLRQ